MPMPVLPQRRAFVAPTSVAAGDAQGMQTAPPQPGRVGAQPPMPMAGNQSEGHEGPVAQMPGGGALPLPLGGTPPNAGGPTSPLNIQSMLSPQQPAPGPGGASAPPPVGTMPPWADQGTPPSAPKRVPVDFGIGMGPTGPDTEMPMAGGPMMPGNGVVPGAPHSNTMNPSIMARLLAQMGKV